MSSKITPRDLRKEADDLIASGSAELAALRLAELWRDESGAGTAAFVVSRYEKLREQLPQARFRLAILRSFTVEPAVPLLRAAAFASGIDLTVQLGDFNAYPQEILDEQSSLYRFAPDGVVLAVRTSDLAPDLWNQYPDLSQAAVAEAVQRVSKSFEQWIGAFRKRSSAALIVHSLEQPARPSTGLLDAQAGLAESGPSQSGAIQQVNQELRKTVAAHRGVYLLDYDALVARHGRLRWHDERKWLIARMPIAADQLIHLSREWLRFAVPLAGKTAKALVVDLDNTLWGGVIGEDGMAGIQIGAEYPGAAYQALQRALLDLSRRGILLAICSKNNLDDALEALQDHPGMLIRPSHFVAMRINWHDKALNLREIASELNVGVDALAFLDDNPMEREQVRTALPQVNVIDLPPDPLDYAATVRDAPAFQRLVLSDEDQQRTQLYAAQRDRSQAQQSFQSKEDFFRYLELEAEIAQVEPATLARVAQLTQKTNQFNLTTRRRTEQQIAELAARADSQVLTIRLRDRFGDHGLVGIAVTRDESGICEIDTFLLSCRVIGRTVETAFLSHVASGAASRGCRQLGGWFLPTKKNAPARDFYAQHGFQLQKQNGEGSFWTLDLRQPIIAMPEWIRLKTNEGARV
jgi:FkbH-like protein